MPYETLSVSKEAGVSIVLLNRPEVMNAINDRMRIDLHAVLNDLENDPTIRVVVLSGSGDAFSAGADLREFKKLYEVYQREGTISAFGGPELALDFVGFSKPLIAAVNGPAVGWGMTMPLTCDLRIASDRARFSAAFVRIGLTPEFGSCHILPQLIGYSAAADLMFTARMIGAEEAGQLGLVNVVVPHEELMNEALSVARRIAVHPPLSVRRTKALLRKSVGSALEEWIAYEAHVFRECMSSSEHYEAVIQLMEAMAAKKEK